MGFALPRLSCPRKGSRRESGDTRGSASYASPPPQHRRRTRWFAPKAGTDSSQAPSSIAIRLPRRRALADKSSPAELPRVVQSRSSLRITMHSWIVPQSAGRSRQFPSACGHSCRQRAAVALDPGVAQPGRPGKMLLCHRAHVARIPDGQR